MAVKTIAFNLPSPRWEQRRCVIEFRLWVPAKCTKLFSGRRQSRLQKRGIARQDSVAVFQLTLAPCPPRCREVGRTGVPGKLRGHVVAQASACALFPTLGTPF